MYSKWKNKAKVEEIETAEIEETEVEAEAIAEVEVETQMREETEEVTPMKEEMINTPPIVKKLDSEMDFQMLCESSMTLPRKCHRKVCLDMSSRKPTIRSQVNYHKMNSIKVGKTVMETKIKLLILVSSKSATSNTDT